MLSVLGLLLLTTYWIASASGRSARQVTQDVVPIISFINDNNYDGSYKYSYETGSGISVSEEGLLKNAGQEGLEAQSSKGEYSYTDPDGRRIRVSWYADETGFHPEGDHIPGSGQLITEPSRINAPTTPSSRPVYPRGK